MRSNTPPSRSGRRRSSLVKFYLFLLAVFFAGPNLWGPPANAQPKTITAPNLSAAPTVQPAEHGAFHYFSFWSDPKFSSGERAALFASLLVALCALAYAGMLVGQVTGAD